MGGKDKDSSLLGLDITLVEVLGHPITASQGFPLKSRFPAQPL
jgi:hypothetical protein